jgi:hypothetical protein
MKLQDWTNIAQIAATAISAIALFYAARQIKLSTRVDRAQFLLELRKMFHEHRDVHVKLRPGGDWTLNGDGPNSSEEWASIEAYMGLFEHCEIMIKEKLLDTNTFKSIYKYRIENIVNNEKIHNEKLINERDLWLNFIALRERCEIN